MIALVVLLTTVVIPLIALTLELLLVLIFFLAGIAGRVLFRRPWTVRARTEGRAELRRQVVGFGESGRVRDALADALRAGSPPPP